MTYVAAHEAYIHDDGPRPDTANAEAVKIGEGPSFRPPALEDAYRIGRMLRVMLSQDLASKLSRYEVSLQKQLSRRSGTSASFRTNAVHVPRACKSGYHREPELLAPNQPVKAFGREVRKPGRIDCTQPAPGPTGAVSPFGLDDV